MDTLQRQDKVIPIRDSNTIYRENIAPDFILGLWPEGEFKAGLIQLYDCLSALQHI